MSRASLLLIAIFVCVLFLGAHDAFACCGCKGGDCGAAAAHINYNHTVRITQGTQNEFDEDLKEFRKWMIQEFFAKEVMPALRMFTTQMNVVAMQQMEAIGMFLDAKNQLETQRLFQQLQAEAHRDYIPSDDFCAFGTNVRSMAASVTKAKQNIFLLGKRALERELGTENTTGADSIESDLRMRWNFFREAYCDPSDNNRNPLFLLGARDGTGLELACGSGADDRMRTNNDVDYTRLVDLPRTINVDFTDGNANSPDEQDIMSMSHNLYGHRVLSRGLSAPRLTDKDMQNVYFALRSVAAKRGVARYTYDAIVGLKASGTVAQYKAYVESRPLGIAPLSIGHTRQYLASIVKELYPYDGDMLNCPAALDGKKLCQWDIYNLIGEDPSYYSQLEILGKKMFQNPDFYVKLYDTPANVERKGVAMQAIELMIDRELYESQLRREMAVSVLLSSRLKSSERRVSENLMKAASVLRLK